MKKKKFKIPTTCALLFIIMILAAVLTWIIPAGEFDTEKVGNLNRVIAGTYHQIESNSQNFWDLIMAVPQGFYKAAKIIFMIMFVGGAVHILEETGSISVMLGKISKAHVNDRLIVLLIMLFMHLGGSVAVFSNAVVALIPIGVLLAKGLGYDAFTGFLMIYMGAYSGFCVGGASPPTVGVAQEIAELPLFSGIGVRIIFQVINFALSYFFTVHYMERVKKDFTRSLNYENGLSAADFMGIGSEKSDSIGEMNRKHIISLFAFLVAIVTLLFGCVKLSWTFMEIGAVFFLLAVFVGLLHGLGVDGTTKIFLQGCSKMTAAAFVVGFANGIGILLNNGHVLNTIVYGLSLPMSKMGPVLGVNFMFLSNLIINFFIPSGSGQAAAVMPIMVPVADLAGITRQVAVQAFQFGDGFTNNIFPTAGTLMGSLAVSKTEWTRYAKWVLPLLACQVLMSIISLTILQTIGWTGI